MNPFPLTAAGIEARLRAMQKEAAALKELLSVYVEHGDPGASEAHRDLRPSNVLRPAPRHTTGTIKVTHFINRAALNGTTEAIHAVVKERPGISQVDLINEVLKRVNTTAKKPKKNVANIARAQVKAGKLAARQGGFYPVPA